MLTIQTAPFFHLLLDYYYSMKEKEKPLQGEDYVPVCGIYKEALRLIHPFQIRGMSQVPREYSLLNRESKWLDFGVYSTYFSISRKFVEQK